MNPSVDYFYHENLRWSFDFQNPNKAAVLFVCLLPLLFLLWNLAWEWRRAGWLKPVLVIASGLILLGDGFCLAKTYSRGGVVAALIAAFYFLVSGCAAARLREGARFGFSAKFNATGFLIGLLMLLVWDLGLGQRSLEPVTAGDASVSHRLALWKSAVQMAVENPFGFGSGNSGEVYMQWYQPLSSTEGYRTMVNSYLTLLVEQGWIWFTLVLAAVSLFWFWARPGKPGSMGFTIASGLRASILAFLVSGIFSTVMEEAVLWIIPVLCALILVLWSLAEYHPIDRPRMIWAFAGPFVISLGLILCGWAKSRSDPLSREFIVGTQGWTVSRLALKTTSDRQKTWVIVPDAKVLGPCYGKLLRQLVAETGVVLEFKKPADLHSGMSHLLIIGNAVHASAISSTVSTVLLAPEAIPASSAQAWLGSSPHLLLLVPSIDEDRRSRFWRRSVPDPAPSRLTVTTLDGVGLRVDWAWEQVINLIRNS